MQHENILINRKAQQTTNYVRIFCIHVDMRPCSYLSALQCCRSIISHRAHFHPVKGPHPNLFPGISYMWAGRWSSAVMKADICDKCSDHKLSNHSRTCLLAAPVVTLGTLSPSSRICVTPPSALRMAAMLDILGQRSH